jgi:hypothetical protein
VDPKKSLPPDNTRIFDDETGRESFSATGQNLIVVTERALPKIYKPGDAAATWVQENDYDAKEEDANYTLQFRLAKN